MKFFVFTFDGYGLPVAQRLQREGHEVVVGQVQDQEQVLAELEKNTPPEDPEMKARRLSLYDGLLDKRPAPEVVEELRKLKNKSDVFVFFDLNHLFAFSEEVRSFGLPGNYPTAEDYALEIDREAAKQFVAKHYPEVKVGENRRFDRVEQATEFLRAEKGFWVLKGLEEDARTVVPDVDDVELATGQILEALTQFSEEYESAGFLLERRIPCVLEFTPQRIYNDGELIATIMVLENKPLGAGNVGPLTDCAQDLAFGIEHDARIAQIAFPPIVDEMARQHQGLFLWDASLLMDQRSGEIYFGEFCANRPGYNALYNQMTLAGGAAPYFEAILRGESPFPENRVGVAVRVFNLHEDDEGWPLAGASVRYGHEAESALWLTDVRQHRRRLVTCGTKPTLGVATGQGNSLRAAAEAVQRSIDLLSFEGAFYRPYFDLISREYRDAIANRIDDGLQRGLFKVGFGIV